MKRFSEQFKKQADKISLKVSEKSELRARIVSYMEYHPLPKGHPQTSTPTSIAKAPLGAIASEPFYAFSFKTLSVRSFAGVFVVFLVVGVPFIAERSLPGDVLYPVKVQFNEEIRATLAFSPYAKVEWETQRLSRRIAEARLLASEGKLTQEAEASFAEAVKTHTDAAQREIAEIKTTDKDGAAIAEIAFASALAVQSQVLANSQETQEGGNSVLALAEVVAQARTSAEASQTDTPSYEKLLAAVEEESTHVYELFTSVKRSASAEEITDVERRLADIERKMRVAVAYKEGVAVEDEMLASRAASRTFGKQAGGEMTTTMSVDEPADASTTLAFSTEIADATTSEAFALSVPVVKDPEEVPVLVHTEADAVSILTLALGDIQKLLTYLTDIDVRENVSIDELVPLTPTAEENVHETMRLYDEALALQTTVLGRDVSSRLREKVARGTEELDLLFSRVNQMMAKGRIDEALKLAEEAHAVAVDLDTLTAQEPVRSEEVTIEDPEVLGTSEDIIVE